MADRREVLSTENIGRNDGKAERHRLECHSRIAFDTRGADEHVRGAEVEAYIRGLRDDRDAGRNIDRQRRDEPAHVVTVLTGTIADDDASERPSRLGSDVIERTDQIGLSFALAHRADEHGHDVAGRSAQSFSST
jgi:hypothetical protein